MAMPGKKKLQPHRKPLYWFVWLALCGVLYVNMLLTPVVYGGCPWNMVSEVTVSPPTPCLELSGRQGAGGCVNPELYGQNNCSETVTISIGKASSPRIHEFAPSDRISVLVDLALGTPSEDQYGFVDRYDFQLPAKIRARDISISFYTYLELGDPLGDLLGALFAFLRTLCLVGGLGAAAAVLALIALALFRVFRRQDKTRP